MEGDLGQAQMLAAGTQMAAFYRKKQSTIHRKRPTLSPHSATALSPVGCFERSTLPENCPTWRRYEFFSDPGATLTAHRYRSKNPLVPSRWSSPTHFFN